MPDRLTLTILGGYLGSGKTTWARHHLKHGTFAPRTQVLVDEAAGMGVDDALLPEGTRLLAGGCACCTGLPALITALRALCDQRSAGRGPQAALLETSGLADPGAIARAIALDPVLVRHLRLTRTITLIDALHGLDQLTRDARAQAQVAAADHLILTKTEVASPPDLARLIATLTRINPVARLEAASHGLACDLPDLPEPGPLPDLAQKIEDLRLVELDLPDCTWPRFALWLSALLHAHGKGLVRVKGFVPLGEGAILLQAVHRHVQPPELLPRAPGVKGKIVLFGQGLQEAGLAASLQRFATV